MWGGEDHEDGSSDSLANRRRPLNTSKLSKTAGTSVQLMLVFLILDKGRTASPALGQLAPPFSASIA